MKRHNTDFAGPSSMKSVQENNMDELLAVLGYNVKSTDINDVADKLEQLDQFMGSVQINGFSSLASDSVHYNPSDLSNWVQTLLSELHQPQQSEETSDYDLTAITGKAVLRNPNASNKRLRRIGNPDLLAPPQRPVVIADAQDNGVRLVHTLMACAEAVQRGGMVLAERLVKDIGFLAVQQAGSMRKVATYFAEALARRVYGVRPEILIENCFAEMLQMHFYETCPYLKFAHFTANQAILEAFQGKSRVHIVDFGINQGVQWPALLQALALRTGGPPRVRLTGIGPPAPDGSDHLQETGWKLAQLADTVNIEFEYRGFVATNLADLDDVSVLNLRDDEAVAVNSVFELHKLLARPGSIEKVLQAVKETKPVIVTVVEQESNHNGPDFLDRFTESLHYYCSMFDSLEGAMPSHDKVMTEVYLGKQICNVVACEGFDRIERFENLAQWRNRLCSAGFVPVHLGSNAYKQASMLLALFEGGQGYKVEENNGCLMLGWHTRPLITTSAWRINEFQQGVVY